MMAPIPIRLFRLGLPRRISLDGREHKHLAYSIGVGIGGGAGPPQYFNLETLLIFIHAAQIAVSQCILHSAPPKWKCFLHLCIAVYTVQIMAKVYSFSVTLRLPEITVKY